MSKLIKMLFKIIFNKILIKKEPYFQILKVRCGKFDEHRK